MNNLRTLFNPNYNIILIIINVILETINIYINKNPKKTTTPIIILSIILIVISTITYIILKIIPNSLITIFIFPITYKILKTIILSSTIVLITCLIIRKEKIDY